MARYLPTIAPDVLMSRRGWWRVRGSVCPATAVRTAAEVNVLYDDAIANYDPFNSAMGKQTLVKISKLDESEIPA